MVIKINNKVVIGAVCVIVLAVICLAGVTYFMGPEHVLGAFYDISLDILEKFLRLPERYVV